MSDCILLWRVFLISTIVSERYLVVVWLVTPLGPGSDLQASVWRKGAGKRGLECLLLSNQTFTSCRVQGHSVLSKCLFQNSSDLRSCVKVEVAVLGSGP